LKVEALLSTRPSHSRSDPVAVAAAAEAAAEAEAADATAGNLKISTKKRRQVGSPLLVLLEPFHFPPSSVLFKPRHACLNPPKNLTL
jgi:hypothetical protein